MRLSRMEIIPIRCRSQLADRGGRHGLLVRLHTDTGISGLGEAGIPQVFGGLGDTPEHTAALLVRFWSFLRGADPFRIGALHNLMSQPCQYAGYKGAEAAVDEALYDIVGKALGQPVHRLLGGAYRSAVDMFGTLGFPGIGVPRPRELSAAAHFEQAKAYLRAGHRGLEVKMGPPVGPHRPGRIQLLKDVLDAAPPETFIVAGFNQGWTATDVINLFGTEFRGVRNLVVEQPTHYLDFEGLARITAALDLPVVADESALSPEAIMQLVKHEAVDMVCLKVKRLGGIYPAMQALATAEAAGMRAYVDYTPTTKLGDTINAHLGAQLREPLPCGVDGYLLYDERALDGTGIVYEGSKARIPDAPGWGTELTAELLAPIRSDAPVQVLD